jgi:preprotein translocase subunit SecA
VESQNFEDPQEHPQVRRRDEPRSGRVIYAERRKVLEGADLHEQVRGMIDRASSTGYVSAVTDGFPEDWDLEQLWVALKTLYPVGVTIEQLEEELGDRAGMSREFLVAELVADAQAAYDRREAELGDEVARELERRVVLSVLDRKWREHLYEMDYLREGIGLRAYSQRDPLVEYQREGFELFTAMMDAITEESVGFLFNLQVQVEPAAGEPAPGALQPAPGAPEPAPDQPLSVPADEHPDQEAEGAPPRIRAKGLDTPAEPRGLTYTAPTMDGGVGLATTEVSETVDDSYSGTARNAPCPCGSGRKYKRCHGDPARRAQLQS